MPTPNANARGTTNIIAAPTLQTGRVDFHLHSYASNVTDYYAANAFSIPESYSDPLALYHTLKARGMSLVTLTDHNSIDGIRVMLDHGLTDVFISSEMTTTFPEDGCNIHITVANMTETQFAEVNRLRGNVYEMVAYADAQIAQETATSNKLTYFMTHPLMSTQNRAYGREGALSVAHIEKALLLCNCMEARNGARTRSLNDLTWHIIDKLDAPTIERLANTHNIAPKGATPWLKSVVGGSDDHAGINPARTWTSFDLNGKPATANSLVESIRARTSKPGGAHGGPTTIAHSILKLLYEGGKRAAVTEPKKTVAVGDAVQSLLQLVFDSDSAGFLEKLSFKGRLLVHRLKQFTARQLTANPVARKPFEAVLETQVYAMLEDPAFHKELALALTMDDRIFFVVKSIVNRIFAHYIHSLQQTESLDLVAGIREVVSMLMSNLFVSLPYLAAFMQQSADCQIATDVRRAFKVEEPQKLVLVTDTYFDVNGVSNTIKRMIREAIKRDLSFTVVTCVAAADLPKHLADSEVNSFIAQGRLKLFTAVANLDFPQYDGLQIYFPPVLEMLKYLQESGFTKVQISTPGLVGLTGLAAAKLLQLETAATYHTSIPEYVENYTKDVSLEAWAWKYMLAFYHAVDETLVPSKFIAKLLHKRGLRNRNLLILDRWVDVARFQPNKRDEDYWQNHAIAKDTIKFVYVGRVAIEKNLHLMAQAYRQLQTVLTPMQSTHLIIIGDGPYRQALEAQLQGVPVTFTGYLHGDDLAVALASCDVKVFPSTTDTWGNAPLEAQACGLPVIVTDIGGPAELMEDGITGIMVRGSDAASLQSAMQQLLDAPTRQRMGMAARKFAEDNRVDEPFTAVFDSTLYRKRMTKQLRKQKKREEQKLAVAAAIEASQLLKRVQRATGSTFPSDLETHA